MCQFLHCPRETHVQPVKIILRFLKSYVNECLWFRKSSLNLNAFSDADWVECVFDKRSTSGYYVYLRTNIISWSANKQHTIARSSNIVE